MTRNKIELTPYEKIWGNINIRDTNFYVIVYNAKKNIYSLHKNSFISGYTKIDSAKDPSMLLKKCK